MKEITHRVGQSATLHTPLYGGSIKVDVMIVNVEKAYGRLLFTVTPVCGSGDVRVNEDSLSNFKSSPSQASPPRASRGPDIE